MARHTRKHRKTLWEIAVPSLEEWTFIVMAEYLATALHFPVPLHLATTIVIDALPEIIRRR